MLLWIARPALWMERPKQECHKCGSTQHLHACNACFKPVCDDCSWGGIEPISGLSGRQCLNCEPLEPDHAFHNLRRDVTKDMNSFTRQAKAMVFMLGFMLGSAFWALAWSIFKDFHQ